MIRFGYGKEIDINKGENSLTLIQITQGKQAIIDDEDFDKLSQYSWVYHQKGYAHTTVRLASGKRTTVKMHRMIMKAPKGIQINGKLIRIGNFKTAIEAAKAYDAKAKELFGEFARLNFKEA